MHWYFAVCIDAAVNTCVADWDLEGARIGSVAINRSISVEWLAASTGAWSD